MSRGTTTRAVVAAAAIAVLSCRTPTRDVPDDSSPVWPNEPVGFSALTDQRWDELTGNGWERRESVYDRIVADSSAGLSPGSVLEYVFPLGFSGGRAPATHYYSLGNKKEIFIGLLWKPSKPWQGHVSRINKLQFIYVAGGGDVAMVMYGLGDDRYELRVLPQWAEHTASWLTPNVSAATVALGEWHRVEWHLKYESQYGAGDGIIRWWYDGVLAGSYTNVRFPNDHGFAEYQLSPTWGGVGDSKRESDFYRFDHSYISAPTIAAARGADAKPAILFEEDFEDGDLESRGWYDIRGWGQELALTSAQARSGTRSLEVRYAAGATGPWLRKQFAPQNRVYTRYYRKWPASWKWPPEVGPHDTYLFAMQGQQWFQPTSTYVTVYTEAGYAGPPRGQRGTPGIDIARVLQGEPDRPLPSLAPPPAPFELDRWYCIETLATMNTAGYSDGRVQLWVDGKPVFDAGNLVLRDGKNGTLKFDSFMFGPYYHFGTPEAQSTWVDALVVAVTRIGCLK